MRKPSLLYALAATPLLMGADVGSVGQELTVDRLPVCASGEYLMYRSGGLVCGTVQGSGGIQWPNCTGQLVTVRKQGDVSSLSCTPRGRSGGAINVTDLTTLEQKVTTLGTKVTQLETNPPPAAATYVGNTDQAVKGDIKTATNKDNGLVGAASLCEAKFGAGAHMCTPYEIYDSVVSGKITSAMNIAKAWVYAPSWKSPLGTNTDGTSGLGDNCGSYTYETAHLQWSGVAVSTGILNTTRWGIRFHGGSAALCNQALPIACCK